MSLYFICFFCFLFGYQRKSLNSKSLKLSNDIFIDPSDLKGFYPNEEGFYFVYSSFKEKNIFLKQIHQKRFYHIINDKWTINYLNTEDIDFLISTKKFRFSLVPSSFKLKHPRKLKDSYYFKIKYSCNFDTREYDLIRPLNNISGYINKTTFEIYKTNGKLNELLKNPKILSITPVAQKELLNRWSVPFLQNHIQEISLVNDYYQGKNSLHENGINGLGEIVTLVDTGLDYELPFFNDDNQSIPFNTYNFNNRKIVRYETLGNSQDRQGGHGTHIAGIIAGDAYKFPLSLYNGIAPKSKLYFVDIGVSNIEDACDVEYDPDDIIPKMNTAKSYIFSNSWGYPIEYTEYRAQFDKIAEENKDKLFVSACGNKGTRGSIYQPSGSKNVLSVGGAKHPKYGKLENILHHNIYLNIQNKNLSGNSQKIHLIPISLVTNLWSLNRLHNASHFKNIPLIYINLQEIISHVSALNNKSFSFGHITNSNNFILVINYSTTKLNQEDFCKVIKLYQQFHNRILCIIIQNGEQKINQKLKCDIFTDKYKNKIPIFSSLNNTIRGDFADIVFEIPEEEKNIKIRYADYSSKGPNDLGILKPDILAPSQFIISANAIASTDWNDDNDFLLLRSGTSMACPYISGASALIRQYYIEGYYINGIKNKSNSINPSSTLLRCCLLNSGRAPYNKSEIPNFETGFGVPKLDDIILFRNKVNKTEPNTFQNYGYRILNEGVISSNEHIFTKFNVSSHGEIRVTLSYIDFALDEDSEIPLACDIDLIVISPSHHIFFGNDKEETHSTNERVIIHENESEIGVYQIHLLSNYFLVNLQKSVSFSLIASGPINNTDLVNNPYYLQFTSFTQNDDDIISKLFTNNKLNSSRTGLLNQYQTENLRFNQKVQFSLVDREWKYFSIQVSPSLISKKQDSIYINIKKEYTEYRMNPSITIGYGQLPKYGGEFISHFIVNRNNFQINIKKSALKTQPINSVLYIGVYPIGSGNNSFTLSVHQNYSTSNIFPILFILVLIALISSIITIIVVFLYQKKLGKQNDDNNVLLLESQVNDL